MTAATTERLITLTQLRGAWAAVTSGVFDAAGADWDQVPVDVVVVGAHGGSGATTMALAIATAGRVRPSRVSPRPGGAAAPVAWWSSTISTSGSAGTSRHPNPSPAAPV